MLTFREYSAARRIHRMFIGNDKNALSPLAKNVQTTRSKFASDERRRAEGIPRRKGSEAKEKKDHYEGEKEFAHRALFRREETNGRRQTGKGVEFAKGRGEMGWIVVDR